ncbi:MAG: YvrJ family protein [Moorella humiferrea]|uniref:YvrJ protein family protein n=1 Tax=Neomoorella humiferrea TaxID=676965 RepID=A0A2T0ANX8_9FIRM|nr:YvrJ family protein [Moorella humiferrea]MBE3572786.1 YvrJ family protein [Moorella humiferrea]PRR70663.1 YvrJ protein family protein [Moorella humiferrea]
MENLWVQIGNYGFPMVVAFYLLVRVEKKLDDLTAAIQALVQTLNRAAPG